MMRAHVSFILPGDRSQDTLIDVANCIPEGICPCDRAEERLVIDGGTPVYYSVGGPYVRRLFDHFITFERWYRGQFYTGAIYFVGWYMFCVNPHALCDGWIWGGKVVLDSGYGQSMKTNIRYREIRTCTRHPTLSHVLALVVMSEISQINVDCSIVSRISTRSCIWYLMLAKWWIRFYGNFCTPCGEVFDPHPGKTMYSPLDRRTPRWKHFTTI